MENVQNGSVKIKAKEFGLFCYEEDLEYNPKNEFVGLFHSPLLVRVSHFYLFDYLSTTSGAL